MNIFVLDKNPAIAARYHADVHVVKMILESAQLLSTAHRVLDGVQGLKVSPAGRKLKTWILPDARESLLYTATHVNHPCAVWVRESKLNYYWLEWLFQALCSEYTKRYHKCHLTESKLALVLEKPPNNMPIDAETEFVQAMPDECKVPGDPVSAYRNYYKIHKADIAEWNHSEKPYWF